MAKREIVVELQLSDKNAVAELGRLQTETRQYQQSLKLLNSIVDENGKATNRQKQQIGELVAKIENNRVKFRELKNDLSGATDAGLRFRDKMAEATIEAIKQSGVLGKLDAQYSTLQQELTRNNGVIAANEVAMKELRDEYRKGELTAKEYKDQLKAIKTENTQVAQSNERLEQEIKGVTAEIGKLDKRVEDLTADMKAGRITAEEFRRGVDSINKEVVAQSTAFQKGITDIKGYITSYVGIAAAAAAVAGLTKELFKLSGEIEKVDARNRAIAQESLPAFTRAAELNANALGLTQRQYVSLAADQALRLKNLGLEGAIVEELALQTVEYADKLGDFSGGQLDTEQAAKLLNDALTGQTKGLKELGINVKASKDEIEAQAQELMRSKGLTEEQATAVATLQLAFRDTGDTLKVFGDQLLGLDAAQDAATAKLEEAKESLAQGLTPAFILATESVADLTDELNRLVSGDGIIAKAQGLVDIIGRLNPAGLIAGFLGENVFAETTKEINDLETATAAYNTALRIGNEELIAKTEANLKAVRALTGETLTAKAVQDSVTQSEAAQAEATDKTTKATEKKAEAVRKLTAEQLARIDAENAIRSDARENIFAQTGSGTETPAVQLQREEQVELDQIAEQAIANRDALREDARIREIRGITDLNAERALLESEWQTGSIASYEEYLARKDNLRRAEVENEMMAAAAISDLFGTIAAAYDKDSAEFKIFATAQALISTYLAANKALASAPPPYNYALVAATVAAGLANVAKIQGFEEGGFTSKRSRDDAPVGVVHANEYVVPAPLLRTPKGKRLVDELERMRLGHPVRYAAPYISGGSTVRFMRGTGLAPVGVSSSDIRSADLTRALTMMPTPVVRVDEINRVQRRVNVIDSLSTA